MPTELAQAHDYLNGKRCVFGHLRHHLIAPLIGWQVSGSRLELCNKFGWDVDLTDKFMRMNDQAESRKEQLQNFKELCEKLGVEIEETDEVS